MGRCKKHLGGRRRVAALEHPRKNVRAHPKKKLNDYGQAEAGRERQQNTIVMMKPLDSDRDKKNMNRDQKCNEDMKSRCSGSEACLVPAPVPQHSAKDELEVDEGGGDEEETAQVIRSRRTRRRISRDPSPRKIS